ncbi:hypothetical protein [Arthrobacter sp. SD76]|uniref:hypothetical protein n=1 Tax=Arthrobacter sp. SD76 TaxID=3415007 RepID=UPI003C731EF7
MKSLQELNPAHHWLSPNSPTPAANPWTRILSAARAGDLPSDAVLLADDADLLSPAAMRDLSELQALGHPLVLTASYSPLLLQRVPPAMGARAAGTALLLGPASFADGDAFGSVSKWNRLRPRAGRCSSPQDGPRPSKWPGPRRQN